MVDVTLKLTLYNTDIFNNNMLPTIEIKDQTVFGGEIFIESYLYNYYI